jgi:pimeloyl-ACP methyl ester carboxylesterase
MRHVPGFGAAFGWLAGRPRLRRSRLVLGDAFADRALVDGEFAELFLDPLHDDPARLAASMKVFRSFDPQFVRDLDLLHRRLDVPVAVVWGERDAFFPVARAEAMARSLPNATFTAVPEAGLFSHEERPEAVAQALLGVLTPATA